MIIYQNNSDILTASIFENGQEISFSMSQDRVALGQDDQIITMSGQAFLELQSVMSARSFVTPTLPTSEPDRSGGLNSVTPEAWSQAARDYYNKKGN